MEKALLYGQRQGAELKDRMNTKWIEYKAVCGYGCGAVLLLMVLGACGGDFGTNAEKGIAVVVPFPPQAYFVERIGGSHVSAGVLVETAGCAETYQVTPKQMDGLSRARMYFRVGMPFEETLLPKIQEACPGLEIVDLQPAAPEPDKGAVPAEGYHHEAGDPHAWLDPLCVVEQAGLIAEALAHADAAHRDDYVKNAVGFSQEVKALHERIRVQMEPFRGKAFYVYHPAFGYFAERYGLRQVAIEREGKAPGQRYLEEVIAAIKRDGAKVVYVEPGSADPSLKAIMEATGVELVSLNPLSREYIGNLEVIAAAIAKGFL